MSSRKIEDLYEPLGEILKQALIIADSKNLPIIITCTLRTPKEQNALYAQGRKDIIEVNKLRRNSYSSSDILGLKLLS